MIKALRSWSNDEESINGAVEVAEKGRTTAQRWVALCVDVCESRCTHLRVRSPRRIALSPLLCFDALQQQRGQLPAAGQFCGSRQIARGFHACDLHATARVICLHV